MPRLTPAQMVGLPWRWHGPFQASDAEGNAWWEIRLSELPDFFVAAPTHEQALAEAGTALEAFLASFVGSNGRVPLPAIFGDRADVPEEYRAPLEREFQVV